jgi:sugar phosphate isomerase/epimerase
MKIKFKTMKLIRLRSGNSRRIFLRSFTLLSAVFIFSIVNIGCTGSQSKKPDSNFNGVKIGIISYSWRSMPTTAEDILNYCIQSGISYVELLGEAAEQYAGITPLPPSPGRKDEVSDEEAVAYRDVLEEAKQKQTEWRLSVSMDKYEELREMFNKAGVDIHIVKFSPEGWTDEEIDYAFVAAKVLGAKGVSNEIGHKACERLGKFAEKHDMYAIFHNHGQPGDPDFSFDEFLAYSPKNMLNFDVGHYYGATSIHPNKEIERLHDRIFSLHLKDKTGKSSEPANTNKAWGEGETPLADILVLVRDSKWPIHCDVELEYEVPEGSDAVKEVSKCVEYCRNILL